jgi:DNA-binding response OmpR family regulator
MPPNERRALGILTHRDIFMLLDHRKIFVHSQEILLSKSEFEILQLLLSQAGRVFSYEQLYMYAYGDDVSLDVTINSVHCHIYRIRQRLQYGHEAINYIESVRSIGYRIAV